MGARELELCAALRVLPAHYLSLKDMLLRDAEATGFIPRTDVSWYPGSGVAFQGSGKRKPWA
jgi:transcriptional adapter 2-alpha